MCHPAFFTIGMAALNFIPVGKVVKVAGTGVKAVRAAKAMRKIEKIEKVKQVEKIEIQVTKKVHNNSHSTTKPAVGYTLRDQNDNILKYGETTQGTKRYTKKFYKENNVYMKIEARGTKKEMHQWQHKKILEYKSKNGGKRPPWDKSDY